MTMPRTTAGAKTAARSNTISVIRPLHSISARVKTSVMKIKAAIDARTAATDSGLARKNTITAGPGMPMLPLRKPAMAPTVADNPRPGRRGARTPLASVTTATRTATPMVRRIASTGKCVNTATPSGTPRRAPMTNGVRSGRLMSWRRLGTKWTLAARSSNSTIGMTATGASNRTRAAMTIIAKPKPVSPRTTAAAKVARAASAQIAGDHPKRTSASIKALSFD